MARIVIPDASGHKVVEYDPGNPADVQRAETLLQKVLREGNLAYRTDNMQVVRGVEPGAEETVVIPQIAGG